MNSSWKKSFACMLALSTLLGVAACGNSTEKQSAADSSAAGTSQTAVTSTEDGPFTPYAETVEITIPYSTSPNVFYVEGESHEDNFVSKFYTEKLNVKYKAKWIVDSSQSAEKLNAAVASNDLPDMFIASPELAGRLMKAGQIQALDEVYNKYASDRLKEIGNYQGGRGFLATSKDGKIYGMPQSGDFANNIPMYFIRKDWLDKLGLQVPTTQDELLNVARAFRDQDPDGNSKKDTIAIAFDKTLGQDRAGINAFANPFKAYSAIWVKDSNDGLVYSSILPEMKTALGFMQTLYSEGLLDKEFAVKDGSKVAEDIAAGKIGIFPGVFWSSLWPLAGSVDNNPSADWVPCTIAKNVDGKKVTQNKVFAPSNFVVSSSFKHPEALIKSMNLWAEMFHGEYSKQFNDMLSTDKYKPIADNWHVYALPGFFQHPEKNIFLSENFIEMWDAQNPELAKTGEASNRWEIVKSGGSQGWAHKKFLTEAEPILKQYEEFVYDEFVGAPTQTMVLRTANLSKLEYEKFIAIIMGESLDSFDKFVSDWKSQGGEKITVEVNEWYKSVK